MAELKFASGFDAWVDNSSNNGNTGGAAVRLQSGERKAIVQIPVTGVRGRTTPSSTLYGHVRDGWVAQTLTAHLAASGVNPDKVTWDGFPTNVAGLSGTGATGGLSAGASVAIDVTEIVQAIMDGAKNHGFVITTNAATVNTANLRSFTSGLSSWLLVVEVSDIPDKPTNPRPNDGSVGSGAPVLGWDGGVTPWTQIQVQADPDAGATSPAYDTGTVASTDSRWDLSADVAFSALASGASTQWRARASNGTTWGKWSDWASFTYTPKHTNTFDSPTGGTIGDPTPSVLAHITGDTLRQYRLMVARGDDRTDIVYDTGHLPPDGTTVDRTIPWRDPDTHRRIIRGDDTSWQIGLRTWGAIQRAEAIGDPTYRETWVTVTFDDDVNEPPADYTVVPTLPGSPIMIHTWTRSEAADAWVIKHGSEVLERLTPDDVTVDAGVYSWNDGGLLQPHQATELHVRAIDAGSRSVGSNHVTVTSQPVAFWIIPDVDIDPIRVKGLGLAELVKKDRRESFQPLNVDTDVDFVYGFEGVSGAGLQGAIDAYNATTEDVLAAVDRIEQLRRTPTARPRIVWASQSVRVQMKNLFALPRGDFDGRNFKHVVQFDCIQDGD